MDGIAGDVPDWDGQIDRGCSAGSGETAARLVTMGMRADSVRPGDAVSVTFHPMKDGARGGQFIQAVLPGGKQVLRANARDENEER